MFDPEEIKKDFPILSREIHGKKLVYLDSAATAQKPEVVIEAIGNYYRNHNANVHRGLHTLGDESTSLYGKAREKIARFVGAKPKELVLVRNTTEAINLVSYAWGRKNVGEGDLIVTSELEHHSNLVVWQELARATGAQLTYVDATEDGRIDEEHLEALLESLGEQVKLVALSWVSNTTGAVLDVSRVVRLRDEFARNAKMLIDGAQVVPQRSVDFGKLGVDFLAFSGHKLYGPMGIGGLVVRQEILESMEPFLVGGGMIDEVNLIGTTYGQLPDKFDAGTPNVAGAVGLSAAVEYLEKIGMEEVEKHSKDLVEYAMGKLSSIGQIRLIGPIDASRRLGSVAFVVEGMHAHDVAQVLDAEGVAVRSGHHCTMPLHDKLGIVASVRASFGIYNSRADIDRLVEGVRKAIEVLGE